MPRLVAASALVLALSAPVPASAATCASAGVPLGASTGERLETAVVCLVNAERTKRGLRKLKVDRALRTAARAHSRDMRDRDFFDHTAPDGSTPTSRARRAGYRGLVAENIAAGYATPAMLVQGWMSSSRHRRNILSRNRAVGVGGVTGGDHGTLWTMKIGSK